ncbi:MAG: SDR family oxidoreductase [Planctomycetota bacterium]|jgi:3-oxoacyl-[acyl-carrier protein] reductase|nr:SDR family oxidoreductase [Planctomycetota bacterium]
MAEQAKRVAIVTGGARGIGLGISRALAQKGRRLAIVYHKDAASAEAARDELRKLTDVIIVQADVSRRAEAARVADTVEKEFGRLDILVNNAGVFDYKTLEEMDEEFFDRIHRTNLMSMLFMSQAVIPCMKKNRFGRIISASSISGRLADIGLVAYGCSKAGVDITTRILSGELGPYGITANAYAPGIIATDMTAALIRDRGEEKLGTIPVGRFGDLMDTGHLVAFLASDEAGYITGEIIGVDGGMFKVQSNVKYEG